MNSRMLQLARAFQEQSVLVIGEAILDVYARGVTRRFATEAPVPIVDLAARAFCPGGAANTAANARTLGADVSLLSVRGDDPAGESLARALKCRRIGTASVLVERGRRTLVKQRILAGPQLLVRLDEGDVGRIAVETESRLVDRLRKLWKRCGAVIVSDHGHGVITPETIDELARLQSSDLRTLVIDSKRLELYRDARPSAIKPNCEEAARLLGGPVPDSTAGRAEWMAAQGPRLLEISGAGIAAVALDCEEPLIIERGQPPYRALAVNRPGLFQTSGAGDSFTAAFALALAAGADAPTAAELAATAAAVVDKDGTSTCAAAKLRGRAAPAAKRPRSLAELAARAEAARREGLRVVLTNGCFDILHRGHVVLLDQARALGGLLIVGVNTDAGIRRLKGPERPINTLEDRAQVLAALTSVDSIIPFDEDTPHALIRAVRPDVFVKGGDYTRASLPEAPLVEELGGTVVILPLVADRSTTEIITRIRQPSPEAAHLAEGALRPKAST